ncbi:MAG: putative metalloprotease CJM1_0395 family protein [Candidatus Thiodiazotropha sp.]
MDLTLGSLSAYNNSASVLGRATHGLNAESSAGSGTTTSVATEKSATQRPTPETGQISKLTPEEQSQVRELQQRDRAVRAHEAAHRAAAGGMASGGNYTYQTGPDGRSYAVGGEVSIRGSSSGTPEEMLRQAETIRQAALAPADPSPQDRRVASQAAAMASQARREINAEQRREVAEQSEERESAKDSDDNQQGNISPYAQRAIASFGSVEGIRNLQSSDAAPIDEII